MRIAIDMDNTLVDDSGKIIRPGIIEFLSNLKSKNFYLSIWTNSPKERANLILKDTGLIKYFNSIIAREDYDEFNKKLPKDLRRFNFDILIDDDPDEINYNLKIGKKGFLVISFRSSKTVLNKSELENILKQIMNFNGGSLWGRILNYIRP